MATKSNFKFTFTVTTTSETLKCNYRAMRRYTLSFYAGCMTAPFSISIEN